MLKCYIGTYTNVYLYFCDIFKVYKTSINLNSKKKYIYLIVLLFFFFFLPFFKNITNHICIKYFDRIEKKNDKTGDFLYKCVYHWKFAHNLE